MNTTRTGFMSFRGVGRASPRAGKQEILLSLRHAGRLVPADETSSSTTTKKFRYMPEAHDPFPLTPALSLGERENRRQSVEESETARMFENRTALHPLPGGEGRGEGKQGLRPVPVPKVTKLNCHCASQDTPKSNLQRRGFSLLEILVAVSLLVVIMVGLLAMFSQTQRALRAGITQVDVMEGGRAAMDLVARELQELAPCKVEFVTNFYAGVIPASKPLVQELPGATARTNELDEVFFLSRTNLVDWVGSGYRIANVSEGVGTLYRFVVTNRYNNGSLSFAYQPARAFAAAAVTDSKGTINPQFRRVLDGVVHLQVRVYNERGEFYDPRVLADRTKATYDADVQFVNYPPIFLNKHVPAYVDIELGVLEPAVYQQYRAQPSALRQEFLKKKAGHVQVFRQRIPIRTGS